MTDDLDQIPELTAEDFARAKPADKTFSAKARGGFKNKGGRPRVTNPKLQRSIRLDSDLLEVLETRYPTQWRDMINQTMREKVMGRPKAGKRSAA